MKPSRESLLVVVLLLMMGGHLAVHGMFWVTSNTAHVDMQYTVTLSAAVSDSVVSLTAAVRNDGRPAGGGINVGFYYSVNSSDWIHFATQPTNRGGVTHARYIVTANGAYDFKATADIP